MFNMHAKKRIHILLVDNSNGYGGIPAMSTWLANGMVKRGFKVTLLNQEPFHPSLNHLYRLWRTIIKTACTPGCLPKVPKGMYAVWDIYPLHPDVNRLQYNFTDNNLKVQQLRSKIKEIDPDVCLPLFGDSRQLVWAVTLLGSGIPYCYTELCSPHLMKTIFWSNKGRLAAMSGADRIHLLHEHHKYSLPDFLQNRIHCIPNPYPRVKGRANVKGTNGKKRKLLWVARFECYKQWKLMVQAFILLSRSFPDWELHMVGHGEELPQAQRFVRSLPIASRIFIHHNVSETVSFFRDAQLFCISSYAEGQPTALLEAQSWGLPCVGFEDCDGVSCQIQDGKTGILVWPMSAQALAEALSSLMEDEGLRQRMQDALLTSTSLWTEDAALDAWEKLFVEASSCKGNTVMDAFSQEPFASKARLSSVARREWLWRDFGKPFPHSFEYNIDTLVKKFKSYLTKGSI